MWDSAPAFVVDPARYSPYSCLPHAGALEVRIHRSSNGLTEETRVPGIAPPVREGAGIHPHTLCVCLFLSFLVIICN